jgi:hypothetical protein
LSEKDEILKPHKRRAAVSINVDGIGAFASRDRAASRRARAGVRRVRLRAQRLPVAAKKTAARNERPYGMPKRRAGVQVARLRTAPTIASSTIAPIIDATQPAP